MPEIRKKPETSGRRRLVGCIRTAEAEVGREQFDRLLERALKHESWAGDEHESVHSGSSQLKL